MIRIALTMLMVCAALDAAEARQAAAAQSRATTPAARKAASPLPKDARKIDDNNYAWTDQEGKSWQFRRTPFGWAKIDVAADANATPHATGLTPMSATEKPSTDEAANVSVVDSGDTVTFVRMTPFGKLEDKRRKSELTAEERGIVERATARRATAAQQASK